VSVSAPPDLAEIYETYHRKVVAYAAKLLGRDHAEDIAQEVFVKVARCWERCRTPRS
jgi:DNA-directed RNA polymerase specialized sigma24 family protein